MSAGKAAGRPPLIQVSELRVERDGGLPIVDRISFGIEAGQVLGVVGESGSGKSTLGLALLGYARSGAAIAGGSVRIDGRDLLRLSDAELAEARGTLVAHIPQEPAAALNPSLILRRQLREVFRAHGEDPDDDRLWELLGEAGLRRNEPLLDRYPHQLSGGQQQRVCIAMATSRRPLLLVLDEPTTGLDVTTQARVLATLREICAAHSLAAVFVSHDMATVAELADQVLVLYAGRLAELGPRKAVFAESAHPYTRALFRSLPDVSARREIEAIPGRPPSLAERARAGCAFAPRCAASIERCDSEDPPATEVAAGHLSRCHLAEKVHAMGPLGVGDSLPPAEPGSTGSLLEVRDLAAAYGGTEAIAGISFAVAPGQCVALVGESGSGKTTLSRCLVGLHSQRTGEISLRGEPLPASARDRSPELRRAIQYVFQNPYRSLNPRRQVAAILADPLRLFFDLGGEQARERSVKALEDVSLPPRTLDIYPAQLSGGERQRVAIARALICEPRVLVCDEVTSALDVSVQASILGLLEQLRERDYGIVFVTHDLSVARSLAQRVLVMHEGRVVEEGSTDQVLDSPRDEYTKSLVADTPTLEVVS